MPMEVFQEAGAGGCRIGLTGWRELRRRETVAVLAVATYLARR
jgi:hypothetical protein